MGFSLDADTFHNWNFITESKLIWNQSNAVFGLKKNSNVPICDCVTATNGSASTSSFAAGGGPAPSSWFIS